MYAARNGETEALALLVEAGADLNAKSNVSAPAGTPRGGRGPGGVGGAGGARGQLWRGSVARSVGLAR